MSDAHGSALKPPTFPKVRAAVAGVLFVCWIGYLAYLVSITRDTIPLARPQVEVADVVVLAEVRDEKGRPAPTVRVQSTIHVAYPGSGVPAGTEVAVDDLPF